MTDLGKADAAFFDRHVSPNLGADRDDVALGPARGVDFGVVRVGGRAVALATDPVFVQPSLGLERAAWFAFHVLVSDVAVSGLAPSHLAVDLNLPPEATDDEVGTVLETFDREARELGAAVVTGHTGRYEGCSYPTVGGGTALAVGDPGDLVRPDGARPGDVLLVTKGPAVETTGLLAAEFEAELRGELGDATVDDALARFRDASPVRDALTAAAAGPVTAMHDATERGVDNALHELADAAGVALAVERDRFPVLPGVAAVCEFFGIDRWRASSEGTVLAAVAPDGADAVLAALADEGVPAAAVGEVREGSGVTVDGEPLARPETDPFWPAYAAFRERVRGD